MNVSAPFAAKHRQVFEIMRNRIEAGDYQPGDRIPSEALLIREFGVSRPTVARALQDLERRGLVSRRRGAGTYVSKRNGSGKHFGLLIPGLGDTEVFEPICGEMARVAQQGGTLSCGVLHMWPIGTAVVPIRAPSLGNCVSGLSEIEWVVFFLLRLN